MVVRALDLVQEVGPDLSLSLDQDLDPRGDPLQGAKVGPDPDQNPDPSREADPKIRRIVPRGAVALGVVVLDDPGHDLPEKNLDHDLLKINPGLDLLRRKTDLGHEKINLGPGPDRQRASPGPDLVQTLLAHGNFK